VFDLVHGAQHVTLRSLGERFARALDQSRALISPPAVDEDASAHTPSQRCVAYVADPNILVRQSLVCSLETCGVEVREVASLDALEHALEDGCGDASACVLFCGYPHAHVETLPRRNAGGPFFWVDMIMSADHLENDDTVSGKGKEVVGAGAAGGVVGVAAGGVAAGGVVAGGVVAGGVAGKIVGGVIGGGKGKDMAIWKPCNFHKICASLAALLNIEIPQEFYQYGISLL
jgi:hypothetical protein